MSLNCQLCPGGGTCSNKGVCSSGNNGTGTCLCNTGYSGAGCEILDGCSPGYGLNEVGDACEPCPPGQLGSGGICLDCALNTYSSTSGAHNCTACPMLAKTGASASTSVHDCICSPSSQYIMKNGVCVPCPQGIECDGNEPIQPSTGFWLPVQVIILNP